MKNTSYSLVVPIYFDASLAQEFCRETEKVFSSWLKTKDVSEVMELIFVSDGSPEKDNAMLIELRQKFPFVKVVILSRNFGQHLAISAGYARSSGQWVAMLNVDQQDPISELPKFFEHAKNNNLDRVYGLREERFSSFGDKISSRCFNFVLSKLTGYEIPPNVSTMRVMSRRFISRFNQLVEADRFLPGLEKWIGFKEGYVPTVHLPRSMGKSSYNFRRRLMMALNSILSFSDYPLKLMVAVGAIVSAIGFFGVLGLIFAKLFLFNFQAGFPTIVSSIVLFSGFITTAIGLSSLYIGRILRESQRRPSFIEMEAVGF